LFTVNTAVDVGREEWRQPVQIDKNGVGDAL
jgi:hypothetical protein